MVVYGLVSVEGEEEIDECHWSVEGTLKPESSNLHKCVVVKGLPKGAQEEILQLYMDIISPVKCSSVKITGTMAVVEFPEGVGMHLNCIVQ